MSRNKELWDKAIEEIDDKYIEETAQTIIKKAGTPIDMNKLASAEPQNTQVQIKKKDSRFSRALPVILASAAALTMIAGAGYILDKYDISMTSTHDGEEKTTAITSTVPDIVTPLTVNDELYRLKWGMTLDEVKDCLTFNPSTNINTSTTSTLQYKDIDFEGYKAILDIVVHNEDGLCEINYHVKDKNTADVFNSLAEHLHATNSGIHDPIDTTLERWHFDAAGFTVSLSDTGEEVIYSRIPLIPEEDRYYTLLKEQEAAKRPEYSWINVDADKIDQYADPHEIILEKAERFQTLSNNYLHYVEENLAYEIGNWVEGENIHDTYQIISEEIKTYEDFKNLFADSVHGEYFDYINTGTPRISEIDGKLCYTDSMGGYLGVVESWFIGYDWEETKITGHFALLKGIEDIPYNNAKHLNDINNYYFYDIVIQNIDGKYVITDCYDAETKSNESSYQAHGYFYNSGMIDRSLITNEKVKPADTKTVTSVVSLDDNQKVTLSGKYGNNMKLQLRQYNVTILDELDTGIYPGSSGEIQTKLYTLDTQSGTLVYLSVPHEENGKTTYTITLYAVIDGKIKQFCDQNGFVVITNDSPYLYSIASTDEIYAGKVIGEERQHYFLNFDSMQALSYYRYPDIDINHDLINYNNIDFKEFSPDEEYTFQNGWVVTFDSTGFTSEGAVFTFEKANKVAETDKAWYFTDLENGMRGGSGSELYVIFKDNPDIMYFYQEPMYVQDIAFCNYDMVFERSDIATGLKSIHTFGDYELITTLEPEKNIKFITRDLANNQTIAEYDTGIVANKIAYTDDNGNHHSTQSNAYSMKFGNKTVIQLYTIESWDNDGFTYRLYFYEVEKDKITPFTHRNGVVYSVLSKNTGYTHIYEGANAFTITDNSLVTGEASEFYCISFDNHFIETNILFPADRDTSLIDYNNMVFDKTFETGLENPFVNKWNLAYMSEDFGSYIITENLPVYETDKAWYYLYEYNYLAELLCIYKVNPGLMYVYLMNRTGDTYYTEEGLAHCDYDAVYGLDRSSVVVPDSISDVLFESKDYKVSLVNDNTLKLHCCDLASGESITMLDTGIICSAEDKPVLSKYTIGTDLDLVMLTIDDDNYLFVSSKYKILTLKYKHNDETVNIKGRDLSLTLSWDNNLNEFHVSGAYPENRLYYKVDVKTATCTTRQIFPLDSNTAPINLTSLTEGEKTVPENDIFWGKWERAYGHFYPIDVYFTEKGVDCYETDTMWCKMSSYNGDAVVYVIMKDNPDYMYRYPYIIGADYRFCNYERVFKRGDSSEKTKIAYQTFNGYSVKLTYTEGLEKRLEKLDVMQSGKVNASFKLHIDPLGPETDFIFNNIKFNGGDVVYITIPVDKANVITYMYHCDKESINEFIAYDEEGNRTKLSDISISESDIEENTVTFYISDIRRNFRIDFENDAMNEFKLYQVDGNTDSLLAFLDGKNDPSILEKVFYGKWELGYDNTDYYVNPGSRMWAYEPMVFSYTGSSLDYPDSCLANSFYEDENGWYAVGSNIGTPTICFVPKNKSDILFYYIYYGSNPRMCDYAKVYKRSDENSVIDTIKAPAQLSALGIKKLKDNTGFDILNPPDSVSYDNAKKWLIGEVEGAGIGEVFLASLSENKITYCRRACPVGVPTTLLPEGYLYSVPNHEAFVYLTLTAEKKNGKWEMVSASDKYGKEFYELIEELDNDVCEAVIEHILNNYTSAEFWNENLSPEKDRITAAAIRKFNNSLPGISTKETRKNILEDDQLVYVECHKSYWQQ